MESNIVNKGYTFTMNQYYSLSQNKVRVDLHSNGTDRVLIQVRDPYAAYFSHAVSASHSF